MQLSQITIYVKMTTHLSGNLCINVNFFSAGTEVSG